MSNTAPSIRPLQAHREYQELNRADVVRLFEGSEQWPKRPCPLCHSDLSQKYVRSGPCEYVQCRECHLVYLAVCPSDELISAYYRSAPSAAYFQRNILLSTEESRRTAFQHRLETIERELGRGKKSLLDIGAAVGTFVDVAVSSGWQAAGVEPNETAVAQAQELDRNVASEISKLPKTFETSGETPAYEVMSCWEVVAHLPNPQSVLQPLLKNLRYGGWFWLSTPNIEALEYRLLHANHSNLCFPFLQLFSTRAIEYLFQQLGLQLMSVETPGLMDVETIKAYFTTVDRSGWNTELETLFLGESPRDEQMRVYLQRALVNSRQSGHMLVAAKKNL